MTEPISEGVRRPGIDMPGGRKSSIPQRHRGAGGPVSSESSEQSTAIFGQPLKRRSRFSKYREQVRQTVVPLGLVDYELHEPPVDLNDLAPSDLPDEEAPEGIVRRWLGTYTAHFDKPYHDPERKLVGFSTYPHQVEVDKNKTRRPTAENDEKELIKMPSFSASLLADDIGKIATEPTFWYAKSGKETIKYDPKRKVLYLG